MGFLLDSCSHRLLTRDLLGVCKPFHCGDPDLDDFFINDAPLYHEALLGKSYCFVLEGELPKIVAAYTLSSDSVHVSSLPNARKKRINANIARAKQSKRYPAILIGRLGVNINYFNMGIGSEMMSLILRMATLRDNIADCRYLAVDAYNNSKTLHFYEKNRFSFLYSSEEQEAENIRHALPLKTRFMFYDLINLKQ